MDSAVGALWGGDRAEQLLPARLLLPVVAVRLVVVVLLIVLQKVRVAAPPAARALVAAVFEDALRRGRLGYGGGGGGAGAGGGTVCNTSWWKRIGLRCGFQRLLSAVKGTDSALIRLVQRYLETVFILFSIFVSIFAFFVVVIVFITFRLITAKEYTT